MSKRHDLSKLPDKTVERLSQYRRVLLDCSMLGKEHIFSHELAALVHIKPVLVRRDLMLIGYSGTLRKGYVVKELIEKIALILDTEKGLKVAIIGLGNLGKSYIRYLSGKRTKLTIVAAFDNNHEKAGTTYLGVPCYPPSELNEVVRNKEISIAILTVPGEVASEITEKLVSAGIKGILSFTSRALYVPPQVYLEEYDMITSLEKVAYFVKG